MSKEKTNKKEITRIKDLVLKQEEVDQKLWKSIISKSKSDDPKEKEQAISLVLNNYARVPWKKAEKLLISLIDPSQDESIRIFVAQLLSEKEMSITFDFYLKIVSKLSRDPSERVGIIVEGLPLVKLASKSLEVTRIFAEQINQQITSLIKPTQIISQHFQSIYKAITIPPDVIRASQSTTSFFHQYSESMSALMKAVETYRNVIQPTFVIPKELLQPIQFEIPNLIEEVFKEGIEQEEIEEIDELIDELKEHVDTLPVFRNVKDHVISGLDSFASQNFHSAFSILLNTVEGIVRETYIMQGLGGTDQNLFPMAEKLRSKKWIRTSTENLIKSLDRDKADHALYGEHSDFPDSTSRLVILCLLKIARDYVYFKVLRLCLVEIRKNTKYSHFITDQFLSLARDRHKMHVERKFVDGKIFLTITLYGQDVFKFKSSGPYWSNVKPLAS